MLGLIGTVVGLPASVVSVPSQDIAIVTEPAYFSFQPRLDSVAYSLYCTEKTVGSCYTRVIGFLFEFLMNA